LWIAAGSVVVAATVVAPRAPALWHALVLRVKGRATVAERLEEYRESARARLVPFFERAGVAYPPSRLVLVGLKEERRLEVWAAGEEVRLRHIRDYEVLAASGGPGPKLREGDRQVPEGLYRVEALNPNSRFHLSLRIGYPNRFDRERATEDGRADLGGDIMIHGGAASVGCLAVGDAALEELFVLVVETGRDNTSVILSPYDFRTSESDPSVDGAPDWSGELWESVRAALGSLRQP
jgi:murein L,D-transpeptidase YafK